MFLLERPSEKQYPSVHTFHSSKFETLERRISEKLKSMSGREKKDGDGDGKCMEYKYEDLAGEKRTPRLEVQRLDEGLEEIFGEVEFEIGIEPKSLFSLPHLLVFLSYAPNTNPQYPTYSPSRLSPPRYLLFLARSVLSIIAQHTPKVQESSEK